MLILDNLAMMVLDWHKQIIQDKKKGDNGPEAWLFCPFMLSSRSNTYCMTTPVLLLAVLTKRVMTEKVRGATQCLSGRHASIFTVIYSVFSRLPREKNMLLSNIAGGENYLNTCLIFNTTFRILSVYLSHLCTDMQGTTLQVCLQRRINI